MNLISPIFGIASAVLIILSGPSYFLSTIRGQTKPHRITWLIWSVLGVTAFISQAVLGARWSLVFTGIDSLGNLGMLLLALRYGVGGWSPLEQVALAIAGSGIVVSLVVRAPLIALLGVIAADAAGYSLTIAKAYRRPASEAPLTWALIAASAACGVVAVGRFELVLWFYPAYLAGASLLVLIARWIGTIHRDASA